MSWSDLAGWWLEEVSDDPAYESVVTPLLIEVLAPGAARTYLDLGCGEGRVMRAIAALGAVVHGMDVSHDLAARVGSPVIVASLPQIPVRDHSYDGVYGVLVLEHISDHRLLLQESSRVVRPGGVMALVVNHPVWTAPGSTPITDSEGEVLWRPGNYFSDGSTEEPAGEGKITFHHRTMGELLNAAAEVGWSLERAIEQPHHGFQDQVGIPRLLACRWRLLP